MGKYGDSHLVSLASPQVQAACLSQDQKIYYYLYNHLGSVAVVIYGDGVGCAATGPNEVEQRKTYTPFGHEHWKMRNDVSLYDPDFGFTGQRFEELLDLTYFNARWYDQTVARFIQADTVLPEGGSQSLNRYSYTVNNPIRYSDPTGHSFVDNLSTILGVVGNIILPGLGGVIGSTIGSAISTAANGGSFGDFAMSAGISIAAGAATGPLAEGVTGAAKPLTDNLIDSAVKGGVAGGLSGAASGAAMAGINGGDVGRGAAEGAAYGAGSGAVTQMAESTGKQAQESSDPQVGGTTENHVTLAGSPEVNGGTSGNHVTLADAPQPGGKDATQMTISAEDDAKIPDLPSDFYDDSSKLLEAIESSGTLSPDNFTYIQLPEELTVIPAIIPFEPPVFGEGIGMSFNISYGGGMTAGLQFVSDTNGDWGIFRHIGFGGNSDAAISVTTDVSKFDGSIYNMVDSEFITIGGGGSFLNVAAGAEVHADLYDVITGTTVSGGLEAGIFPADGHIYYEIGDLTTFSK